MKILQSAIVAFSLAISMGTFSTAAMAYEEGRISFTPLDAINMSVEKAQAAKAALGAGADAQEVAALMPMTLSTETVNAPICI